MIAFESDGDVKRRYGYGPTGEVLFDQVFDATVTTPSQSEIDLLLPLGDHQHSTRVVLAHDANDAAYVRQSLDYAQFGRITATLGANGLADSTGVVTAFAHHGSLLDAATGLQRKGERWYSPDLGRFVSDHPRVAAVLEPAASPRGSGAGHALPATKPVGAAGSNSLTANRANPRE